MVVGASESQVAKVSLISYFSVLNRSFGVGLKGFAPLYNFIQRPTNMHGHVLLWLCLVLTSLFIIVVIFLFGCKHGNDYKAWQT